jgi:mannose-6-phosphate isomerase-like protein (cupin superfamily)
MRISLVWYSFSFAVGTMLIASPATPQTAKPQPLVIPLHCAGGDCPLLKGVPQTAGMRSGYVRLLTGTAVGWHTTGKNEESLVILKGQGEALIEGEANTPFTAPTVVYIPPATRHNIRNTGGQPLQYVYVVAPAKNEFCAYDWPIGSYCMLAFRRRSILSSWKQHMRRSSCIVGGISPA